MYRAGYGGVRLDSASAPDVDQIREAFIRRTVDIAQASGLHLTESDKTELREWLRGEEPAATAADPGPPAEGPAPHDS